MDAILKNQSRLYFLTTLVLFIIVSFPEISSAQYLPTQDFLYPNYNIEELGSPIISSTPVFDSGVVYNGNSQPFPETLSTPLQISQGVPFSTFIPQSFDENFNANTRSIVEGDGRIYTILGDVTGAIPFGGAEFDSIPFLNEKPNASTTPLPPLRIPQNEEEFQKRMEVLIERFTNPNLSTVQSTPARLLHYSLIGGANQVFLSPTPLNTNTTAISTAKQTEMKPMYTLGALCWNVPCANRRLLKIVNNRPVPEVGVGFQTQRGEFLECLAFAKIDRKYELKIDGKTFSVQDLIEWEKYSCSSNANLSHVAIGLAHYSQNPDEVWINQFGEQWSLEKILEHESRRAIDWNTVESTEKLLAFTYLLARLKQSPRAQNSQLASTLQKTEAFLITVKKRAWDIFGDNALSDSLFFNPNAKLTTPYLKLYVNGKILRWLTIVSSNEELQSDQMKRAMMELCALVDQLFNSIKDLDQLSSLDEESLATALQTLQMYKQQL